MKREQRTNVFSLYGLGGGGAAPPAAATPGGSDPFAAFAQTQTAIQADMKKLQQQMSSVKKETGAKGGNGNGDKKRKRTVAGADLAHVHPRLKAFFQPLHEMYEGSCMFSEVMALAGKKISDMPTLPNYCTGDRNGLCFNWLGGCCHFDPCA